MLAVFIQFSAWNKRVLYMVEDIGFITKNDTQKRKNVNQHSRFNYCSSIDYIFIHTSQCFPRGFSVMLITGLLATNVDMMIYFYRVLYNYCGCYSGNTFAAIFRCAWTPLFRPVPFTIRSQKYVAECVVVRQRGSRQVWYNYKNVLSSFSNDRYRPWRSKASDRISGNHRVAKAIDWFQRLRWSIL